MLAWSDPILMSLSHVTVLPGLYCHMYATSIYTSHAQLREPYTCMKENPLAQVQWTACVAFGPSLTALHYS